MKRKIRTVQIFIGIVLVFFLIKDCGIPFIRDFNEGNFSRDELRDKMKSSTKEYLSLFTYPAQKEMRLDAFTSSIFISKSQHPILIFDYGGKPSAGCNYLIIIQKVNLSSAKPLYNTINSAKKNTERNYGGYSGTEFGNNLSFLYSQQHDSIIKKIYLSYDGDLIRTSKMGDSIINFRFKTQNLTFGYETSDLSDLIFENKDNNSTKPFQKKVDFTVSFYKKKSSIYIIVIRPIYEILAKENPLINTLLGTPVL